MATSRATRLRSEKFDKNVTKRGNVPVGKAAKREEAPPVSPVLLGFFVFVVVGSAFFQIIRTAQSGPIF
ncbi:hypothetical protein NSK_000216 [Nannochloropsis salina CCMP1776]|uniref:Stress-associated endoplasmic reticulum protein n=1 Tax=Nannochloropsis salina CCMP1776 TaxID=1027361 RepID=A0A4D9DDX7_9STRA|nr:hypothetical protein NSK_000216 [Nannochloropsis salina CCMP1776]|eukprot:TFJ88647.1 hypothetical protein NSK_000216 [Nannochloropsis salina CCMP1776]